MRRLLCLLVLAATCIFVGGCYTYAISAPADKHIGLLSQDAPATVKFSLKTFYLLEGLIPISNNNLASVLLEHGLTNVRVQTYWNVWDYIVTEITGGLISSKTTAVQGTTSNQ